MRVSRSEKLEALLIGGADGLGKLLFLFRQRLFRGLQLGGLDVDLLLQALDILLDRRDLLLGQVDLLLQRLARRLHVIGLRGQVRDALLHCGLLLLQLAQLVLERRLIRIVLRRGRIDQAGRQHGRQHRNNQNARHDTRDQAHGFLFHHSGIRSFVCCRWVIRS